MHGATLCEDLWNKVDFQKLSCFASFAKLPPYISHNNSESLFKKVVVSFQQSIIFTKKKCEGFKFVIVIFEKEKKNDFAGQALQCKVKHSFSF
jgi:hypothetical protein